MNYFVLLLKGGMITYIIFGASIIALTIIIERLFVLYHAKTDTDQFIQDIRDVIKEGRIKEAITVCSRSRSSVAKIIGAGLKRHNKPREEINDAIETAGRIELGRLEKNLTGLSSIAAITPLLGFLGTVTGMIRAFRAIQRLSGHVDVSILAGGIWEALVTTALGLAVAIPVIFAYNYLVSRIEGIVLETEKTSFELLDLITE
jgi:biopolymer transport protein ExbB